MKTKLTSAEAAADRLERALFPARRNLRRQRQRRPKLIAERQKEKRAVLRQHAEFDEAFDKLTVGLCSKDPEEAKSLLAERARSLGDWLTPRQKRTALRWQAPLRQSASLIIGRATGPISLTRLCDTTELRSILQEHGIAQKTAIAYLHSQGFKRGTPGRPKKG